jgi:hypothetical protein
METHLTMATLSIRKFILGGGENKISSSFQKMEIYHDDLS